jgi:hypothetical protein
MEPTMLLLCCFLYSSLYYSLGRRLNKSHRFPFSSLSLSFLSFFHRKLANYPAVQKPTFRLPDELAWAPSGSGTQSTRIPTYRATY